MVIESEDDVDHYAVLGLPSSPSSSSKLTLKEIEKAYRNQSRIRHPDKRPDDPNATSDFQRLTSSFQFLRDESKRAAFDAKLRAKRDRVVREAFHDGKRRRLATDLEKRERDAAAEEDGGLDERREKRVASEVKRELDDWKAKNAAAASSATSSASKKESEKGGVSLDKEKVLKVSWDREMGDYGAVKLKEIFERFGGVEDVVIRSKGSKKRGSAVVVMSSKDAAIAATHTMSGTLSSPLLVLPVEPAASNISSSFPPKSADTISSKIVGAGFQDYEASILEKLQKAKEKKNMQ